MHSTRFAIVRLGLWKNGNHDPPSAVDNLIAAFEADLTIDESYSQEDTSEDSQIQLAPEPKPKVTKTPTLIDNTYKTVEQKLEVLQRWHQKGLISSEEYQKEKDKILKTFK